MECPPEGAVEVGQDAAAQRHQEGHDHPPSTDVRKRKAPEEGEEDASEEDGRDHHEDDDDEGESAQDAASSSSTGTAGMSKKALKRLRKAEETKAKRRYQRQQRKERKKKARLEEREKRASVPPGDAGPAPPPISKWKRKKMLERERVVLPQRVVIDCSFDSRMTEREVMSLVNQLARCYSCNNSSLRCMQLTFTSFGGSTAQRCKIALPGYENWTNIRLEPKGYLDLFKKEELVYLTSESPNVIDTLEDDKVYIIGGLVDHNRLKGLTYKIAEEQGIATAQLPIGEYLRMSSRKVLAVNHVFEILLQFKLTGDWEKALIEVIPQRKGAQRKTAQTGGDEEADSDSDAPAPPTTTAEPSKGQTSSS